MCPFLTGECQSGEIFLKVIYKLLPRAKRMATPPLTYQHILMAHSMNNILKTKA